MKKIILSTVTLLFVWCQSGYPIDSSDIVAYPVPFNPRKTRLNIGYKQSGPTFSTTETITYTVVDINGDKVYSETLTPAPKPKGVVWNGRNSSGDHVKPGFYIIKVIIKDSTTGLYCEKILRILIRY